MAVILKNNAKCDLGANFTTSDTTIDIGSGNEINFPVIEANSGNYFYLTCIDQNDDTILEILKVIRTNGNLFDVVRGIDGTTPRAGAVGDKLEMRITQSILQEIANYNDKRKYLDEIFLCYEDTEVPSASIDIENHNKKNAPKLIEQWNSYWGPRTKVLVENLTDNIKYDNLEFNTIDDMYNWMNDKHTENSSAGYSDQTFVARPYEIIDQTIPVITRMYGINRFFSALRGRRRYIASAYTASYSSNMEEVCANIFNSVHSTSFTSATINLDAIWLTCSKKNLYSNPKMLTRNDYRIDLSSTSSSRMVYNSSASAWESHANDLYLNDDVLSFRYAVLDSLSNVTLYENNFPNKIEIINRMSEGDSVVMCVGIYQASDGHKYAVTIKPMGIDNILIDYPDFSKYDLEFLYFNMNKQNLVDVKVFSSISDFSSLTDYDINKTKIRINCADWLDLSIDESAYTSNFNSRTWDTVRFRLRDKNTRKVGELSYSGIVTQNSTIGPAFRRMYVKSFDY